MDFPDKQTTLFHQFVARASIWLFLVASLGYYEYIPVQLLQSFEKHAKNDTK